VRESLAKVAGPLGASQPQLSAVFGRWEELVGPVVAAHAKPVALQRGTLVVHVDEPGWATQLRFLSADVIGRIDAATEPGVVQRIDVRVRPS
jgi:predicted nucleic acid-binding Zn ribbon protein